MVTYALFGLMEMKKELCDTKINFKCPLEASFSVILFYMRVIFHWQYCVSCASIISFACSHFKL